MIDISSITRQISALRAQTSPNSITPEGLGTILQKIANLIGSLSQVPEQESTDLVARVTQCESDSQTALQAARSAQETANGNVIDSFTHSQDEDELSLSIKQHGHSAEQVVLPAASSTGAGIMTATDKSHLDLAYGKRVSLMSAPSSESTVTLTITFGDGTTKSVTFVGAAAGTGGKAGLMTKEQADQLAALVAAGTAENVRDDAGYLKQQYAAPVILRNVSDETVDDLSVGDIFYDAGKLWQCGTTENTDMGAPSKKVIYYCLADQMLYRWTGSRFVQAISISSGDVTVPTKLSDLINDMGFLTAHQPLKTINGQTITGTGNITIDGAAELKDASSHIKQSVATPVVLRNVTDAVPDVLNIGDIYYDSGILWCYDAPDTHNLGAPSKNLVYFCIANNSFYRWTGASFTQITTSGGGGASEILALNGVSSNQDGTIVFTDTAGNTYTVNLNHTHENMAKLVVCEESDLPSTLDPATIYAITDSGETEIEKLVIRGMEFVGGGGVSPSAPRIVSPANGSTIDVGSIAEGESSVNGSVNVQARNLTQPLTFAITSGTGFSLAYGQQSGASVSIPAADAMAVGGANVTIVCTNTATNAAGVLSIGSTELSTIDVSLIANKPTYTDIAGVKLTGTQYLRLNYQTNPNTKIEIDMQFEQRSGGQATNYTWIGTYQNHNGVFYANFGTASNQHSTIFYWFGDNGYVDNSNTWSENYVNQGGTISYIQNPSKFVYTNGNVSFQGENTAVQAKTISQDGDLLIGAYLGASQSSTLAIFDRYNLKIFSIKISENGTTLLNLVPKLEDGTVPCLYDTVNEVAYKSETSTQLEAITQNS